MHNCIVNQLKNLIFKNICFAQIGDVDKIMNISYIFLYSSRVPDNYANTF